MPCRNVFLGLRQQDGCGDDAERLAEARAGVKQQGDEDAEFGVLRFRRCNTG